MCWHLGLLYKLYLRYSKLFRLRWVVGVRV